MKLFHSSRLLTLPFLDDYGILNLKTKKEEIVAVT